MTYEYSLTGTGSSPHPNAAGVTFQSAANDIFEFDGHETGSPALATMFIYVDGTIRSVVPYSYTGYTGENFKVTYANGDGPFTGTFVDGNRTFGT